MAIPANFYPDASINLDGIEYTEGAYTPQFSGVSVRCIGAMISSGEGVLVVHPVRNAEGDNLPLVLSADSGLVGCYFDQIIETGTTADLSNTHVFPQYPEG